MRCEWMLQLHESLVSHTDCCAIKESISRGKKMAIPISPLNYLFFHLTTLQSQYRNLFLPVPKHKYRGNTFPPNKRGFKMTCSITFKECFKFKAKTTFLVWIVGSIYLFQISYFSHIFPQFKWGPLPKTCTCERSATQLQQLAAIP